MSQTFGEASDLLGRFGADLDVDLERVLGDVAERVAEAVANEWPVDSGQSQAGWQADGTDVINDVAYTSHVHEGLAAQLVPRHLEAHEELVSDMLDQRQRDLRLF